MDDRVKHYGLLDICRLYCALFIVLIHLGIGSNHPLVQCVARQGVPFFFLISGFFFSKKISYSDNILKPTISYVFSLLFVYFVWVAIWFPKTFLEYRQMYSSNTILLILVCFRRIFIAGLGPYWYLLVLAESSIPLAIILKKNMYFLGFLLCITGIILSVIYNYQNVYYQSGTIYKVFYTVFSWNNNVFLSGFPMMFIGAMAERYKISLKEINFTVIFMVYLLSVSITFLFYFKATIFIYIPFAIIQAVLLFLLSIISTSRMESLSPHIYNYARNLSSTLFLTHNVSLLVLSRYLCVRSLLIQYILAIVLAAMVYQCVKAINNQFLFRILMIKK